MEDLVQPVVSGLIVAFVLAIFAWLVGPIRRLIRHTVDTFEIDIDQEQLPAIWTASIAEGFLSVTIQKVEEASLRGLEVRLQPGWDQSFGLDTLRASSNFTEITGTSLAIRIASIERTCPQTEAQRPQKKRKKKADVTPEFLVKLQVRRPRRLRRLR